MTFRENLSDYAARSSSLINESPQMDEENTKRKVIEPLLELLGWNIVSSEIELEYSVQMGSGTKKVDYALKLGGTPVVFIEAKGCDTTLNETNEDQLRSYMRQVGIDWGLLTNGREFEILRRDKESDRPNEISLARFSIDEVSENRHPLKALSKDSISTGESQQIAENIQAMQRAVRRLEQSKESVAEDVTRVVTDIVGETVSQRVEDEAKEFVDNLITTLQKETHKTKAIEKRSNPDDNQSVQDGKYTIRLIRDGSEVHIVAGDTQGETTAALVNYLIQEHSLLDNIEVPYVPGTGRGSRALINDEPRHTNGEEMRLYEILANGDYLFTSLSAEDKNRYVSELPRKVGLECEFDKGW